MNTLSNLHRKPDLLATYFTDCKAAYLAYPQQNNIAVFLIDKSDYVGMLVHHQLAREKEYAEFFSNDRVIAAHLPKSTSEELMRQIFASFSQDFEIENLDSSEIFACPVFIFTASTSSVIDLHQN